MPTAPTPPPAPFMLFFRNSGPETHQHLSPAQRQELVTRWNAWFETSWVRAVRSSRKVCP